MPEISQKDFNIPQPDYVEAKELYKGALGTSVVADITFKSAQYLDNYGRTVTTPELTLYEVLINSSCAKKIVRTEIQGRSGTVKEYIGMDDVGVSINGVLTARNGELITDFMDNLIKVSNAPIPLEVVCEYLQKIGVYNLVIESLNMDQNIGRMSQQNFTLQCLSDEPVELQIVEAVPAAALNFG